MKKEKSDNILININKKKLLNGIGIVVVVLAIIGLSFVASKSYGSNIEPYEFNEITIDEYLELLKSEEKSIIYIARPGCSFCIQETPILKKVASKYDLEVNYLDTSDFFDSVNQQYTESGLKFVNSAEEYKEGYGTPNTIIVQNGKIVDGVYQYVEESELVELFKNNGFING